MPLLLCRSHAAHLRLNLTLSFPRASRLSTDGLNSNNGFEPSMRLKRVTTHGAHRLTKAWIISPLPQASKPAGDDYALDDAALADLVGGLSLKDTNEFAEFAQASKNAVPSVFRLFLLTRICYTATYIEVAV